MSFVIVMYWVNGELFTLVFLIIATEWQSVKCTTWASAFCVLINVNNYGNKYTMLIVIGAKLRAQIYHTWWVTALLSGCIECKLLLVWWETDSEGYVALWQVILQPLLCVLHFHEISQVPLHTVDTFCCKQDTLCAAVRVSVSVYELFHTATKCTTTVGVSGCNVLMMPIAFRKLLSHALVV